MLLHSTSCMACICVQSARVTCFYESLLWCACAGAGTLKKQAELFFPPEFADDFPVAMQISEKYGLVYVITKLGLLFVYDLASATAVYRNRISPDPIFLTANSADTGGFYAINRFVLKKLFPTVPHHCLPPLPPSVASSMDGTP